MFLVRRSMSRADPFLAACVRPSALLTRRSAFQSRDQPQRVRRQRVLQHVGIDPGQFPRDGELQGTISKVPVAVR
jgi:hypothetical protein